MSLSATSRPPYLVVVRLHVEVEGEDAVPAIPGEGTALVALMSFAVSRGFGASHPLIALADRLHDTFHVPMGPLTTFYEAAPEDEEDETRLAAAWQPAAALGEALAAVVAALESDAQCVALSRQGGASALRDEIAAILPAVARAAATGRRVRLSYAL